MRQFGRIRGRARAQIRTPCAQTRTRFVPRHDVRGASGNFGQNARARIGPAGAWTHGRSCRPSAGSAARTSAACSCTRRRFERPSRTMTAAPTNEGRQPLSRMSSGANRTFRSRDPRSCWRSTIAVLSSMTSNAPDAGCHARRSMTPRSPQREKETSGRISQPSATSHRVTASPSRAWARSSSQSISPPIDRTTTSNRRSTCAATLRSVRNEIPSTSPRSIRDKADTETPASELTSRSRRRRLCRTARSARPTRTSSMG